MYMSHYTIISLEWAVFKSSSDHPATSNISRTCLKCDYQILCNLLQSSFLPYWELISWLNGSEYIHVLYKQWKPTLVGSIPLHTYTLSKSWELLQILYHGPWQVHQIVQIYWIIFWHLNMYLDSGWLTCKEWIASHTQTHFFPEAR